MIMEHRVEASSFYQPWRHRYLGHQSISPTHEPQNGWTGCKWMFLLKTSGILQVIIKRIHSNIIIWRFSCNPSLSLYRIKFIITIWPVTIPFPIHRRFLHRSWAHHCKHTIKMNNAAPVVLQIAHNHLQPWRKKDNGTRATMVIMIRNNFIGICAVEQSWFHVASML